MTGVAERYEEYRRNDRRPPALLRLRLDLLSHARRFEPGAGNAAGVSALHAAPQMIADLGATAIEACAMRALAPLVEATETLRADPRGQTPRAPDLRPAHRVFRLPAPGPRVDRGRYLRRDFVAPRRCGVA